MSRRDGSPVDVSGEIFFTDVNVDERDNLEVGSAVSMLRTAAAHFLSAFLRVNLRTHANVADEEHVSAMSAAVLMHLDSCCDRFVIVQYTCLSGFYLSSLILGITGPLSQITITVPGSGAENDAFRRWLRQDGAMPIVEKVQGYLDALQKQTDRGEVRHVDHVYCIASAGCRASAGRMASEAVQAKCCCIRRGVQVHNGKGPIHDCNFSKALLLRKRLFDEVCVDPLTCRTVPLRPQLMWHPLISRPGRKQRKKRK